jgi:hypothetical protein
MKAKHRIREKEAERELIKKRINLKRVEAGVEIVIIVKRVKRIKIKKVSER